MRRFKSCDALAVGQAPRWRIAAEHGSFAHLKWGDPLTPDEDDRLDAALVGRHLIEREFGQGGMATVHLAQELGFSGPNRRSE